MIGLVKIKNPYQDMYRSPNSLRLLEIYQDSDTESAFSCTGFDWKHTERIRQASVDVHLDFHLQTLVHERQIFLASFSCIGQSDTSVEHWRTHLGVSVYGIFRVVISSDHLHTQEQVYSDQI